jgi:hypothetical protein
MQVARELITRANADTDYLTLAEAKQHLRVTASSDDAYITSLISMALDTCESYVGYSIRKGTVKYAFDGFTGGMGNVNSANPYGMIDGNLLRLYSRILSITNVKYVDSANAVQTTTNWVNAPVKFGQYGISIYFDSIPGSLTSDEVKLIVEVVEGFELASATANDSDKFPATIKHAALLLIGQYYDNRNSVIVGTIQAELSLGFEYLLDKYRIVKFG